MKIDVLLIQMYEQVKNKEYARYFHTHETKERDRTR